MELAPTWRRRYLGEECPPRYFERHKYLVTDEMKLAADAELRASEAFIWGNLDAAKVNARFYRRRGQAGWYSTPHYSWWVSLVEDFRRLPEAVRIAHSMPAVHAYAEAHRRQSEAADADWADAVANRPIDDAAWKRELERRRRTEAFLAGDRLTVALSDEEGAATNTTRAFHRELKRLYVVSLNRHGWGGEVVSAFRNREAQPGTSHWQRQTCRRYAGILAALLRQSLELSQPGAWM